MTTKNGTFGGSTAAKSAFFFGGVMLSCLYCAICQQITKTCVKIAKLLSGGLLLEKNALSSPLFCQNTQHNSWCDK
jgi:hypothetical protein